MAQNVREVAECCVFSMMRVSGESKSRLVKAAGAESCGQRRNQKLHAAVARSTFSSENIQNMSALKHFSKFDVEKLHAAVARSAFSSQTLKNSRSRSTFWSSNVEKLHAAVARSTFASQHVQGTFVLAHVLKFRGPKISQLASQSVVNQSVCEPSSQVVNRSV